MRLLARKIYVMSWAIVAAFAVSGCASSRGEPNQSELVENPNMARGAPLAAANNWLDTKETADNGNDPGVAGCQDVYTTQNSTCGVLADRWGDLCDSPTHILERVVGVQCSNGRQPGRALIDCRQFLNNPQARCVEIPNACPPGNFLTGSKSARCEIPVVPVPLPNPTIKKSEK